MADPEKSLNEFKTEYRLYLAQDSVALYDLTAKEFQAEGISQTKLLDDRNSAWIPAIEKNIALKPSFIGVGSGHLGGEKGLVSLLRAKGYHLQPIKL